MRPDQWEIVAIPDPQAHLVSRVCPEQLAKKEQRSVEHQLVLFSSIAMLLEHNTAHPERYEHVSFIMVC